MSDGITYQNKDVLFKVLSQNYENKSFQSLGLDLPKIKKVLPTNFPKITANEVRADNIFLLEDDRILIVEYESAVKQENFIKYLEYVLAILKIYFNHEKKLYNVVIAVIYTGDINEAPKQLKTDSFQLNVLQSFLSRFDTKEIYTSLKYKIESGQVLTDEDVMKFIVLPLTEPINNRKQGLIEKTINLAKEVADEQLQVFIMAGILVATDKFIDRNYSKVMKEWISMTKIARMFEEEKIDAVNHAVNHAVRDKNIAIVRQMLQDGEELSKIMKYTGLSKDEVLEILDELSLKSVSGAN